MSFKYIERIPSVGEILESIPLPTGLAAIKAKRDEAIAQVFRGESDKFIVIIGPCSAHDENAVCDYIERLARVQEKVADRLIVIPRIYTNKPRTTGEGYKGMAHQPDPTGKPDVAEGIRAIRRMHIRSLQATHMPAADEMLYPDNYSYLEDLLSYVAVGARSVENQQHRLVCSGLAVPVGMKNPTSGDIEVMLNSIRAAQIPHTFSYNGWVVETQGNPLSHAVLRGSVDKYGVNHPNYHFEDIARLSAEYLKRGLLNPAVVVDVNHCNSGKKHREQPRIVTEVLDNRHHSDLIRSMVKGVMVESFIEEGAQPVTENVYGKSITDPCLGWKDSEALLMAIAENC